MIRFDQRQFDVPGTQKVFKKVVHPGQNIRLVDKDGIPLKAPNSTTLTRLHSQYVLSPRGVPTKRSNHSYSGQLAQAKLHTVVNSLDTTTQPEMMSYSSVHNYNGLSSAPSSQQYTTTSQRHMPGNLTPKKRAFGSGPPRSVKSMPTKSASTQRTRYLTSAATTTAIDQMSRSEFEGDADKTNDSAQGKRLGKEWSALNQCRALKRSSEIVSHRVDRMYFMSGNKLSLRSKYLIEEDELKHLRELTEARASSRASRSNKICKGDIYHPDTSVNGDKHDDDDDDNTKQAKASEGGGAKTESHKKNGKKKPQVPSVTKQTRSSKSPLVGWEGTEIDSKDPSVANENVHKEILHEDKVNGEEEEENAINGKKKTVNEDSDEGNTDNANVADATGNGETGEQVTDIEKVVTEGEQELATPANVNGGGDPHGITNGGGEPHEMTNGAGEPHGMTNGGGEPHEMTNGGGEPHGMANGESVQEDIVDNDGDKTVVKSEDYLDSVDA